MSKTSWFQVTLLLVWGVFAVAALSGAIWLTRADWVQTLRADADSLLHQDRSVDTLAQADLQEEVLVLRDAVARLDQQNRILMSRLQMIENDASDFTASIAAPADLEGRSIPPARSQKMPDSLHNPLENKSEIERNSRVATQLNPYPLKMQGTGRAPTDAEISQALRDQ